MKNFLFLKPIILLLLLGTLFVTYSQEKPISQKLSNESASEEAIKINSFLVNIPLVVSDKSGRYLSDLKKEDFNIFENNVAQEVAFFSNESVPTYLILILDCSGSTDSTIGDIKTASTELIKNLKDTDQAMVVSFADNVITNQPFTSDKTKLLSAVNTISAIGSTKLYDSVYLVARNILPKISGRKAIVLLTDGQDTSSSHDRQEAINQLVESGSLAYVVQYPISTETNFLSAASDIDAPRNPLGENADLAVTVPSVSSPRAARGSPNTSQGNTPNTSNNTNVTVNKPITIPRPPPVDSGFLSSITEVTGGRFYKSEIGNLSIPMRSIGEELRNVYVISYYPSTPIEKKGVRKLKIKLNKDPKVAIRHRGSYDAGKIAKNLNK